MHFYTFLANQIQLAEIQVHQWNHRYPMVKPVHLKTPFRSNTFVVKLMLKCKLCCYTLWAWSGCDSLPYIMWPQLDESHSAIITSVYCLIQLPMHNARLCVCCEDVLCKANNRIVMADKSCTSKSLCMWLAHPYIDSTTCAVWYMTGVEDGLAS